MRYGPHMGVHAPRNEHEVWVTRSPLSRFFFTYLQVNAKKLGEASRG